MAEQNRPASKALAPDPSNNYERSHPENEAGQGRLDANTKATPIKKPDKIAASVGNAQDGSKQINAHDSTTGGTTGGVAAKQPDHSMLEEEPLGWDQTSSAATSDQTRRHPRTGGKGGTPDAGESTKKS